MKAAVVLLASAALFAQAVDQAPRTPSTLPLASLPSATTWAGRTVIATSVTSGSCTVAGSGVTLCYAVGGAWVPLGASVGLFGTNAQTSTYQVLAADFAACKTITVASGTFTITLVASGAQPADGQCLTVLNYGTGVVTLARSGQNINGAAANLTGTAGSATAPTGWRVYSNGTNYFAEVIGGGAGSVAIVQDDGAGFVIAQTVGSTVTIRVDAAVAATKISTTRAIGVAVGDPAGSVLATGVLGYVVAPAACTIIGWDIVVDAGTATVDVWKIATGTAKPTVANTITASAKPAIASDTVIASTTLTSWTTSVLAGDIFGFNLDTVATAKYITVDVRCQ